MGQYENQTLSIISFSLFPGNNYTFLITNRNDLGIVSAATVSSTLTFFPSPNITRIDVNFMSNIVKRFENINIFLKKLILNQIFYYFSIRDSRSSILCPLNGNSNNFRSSTSC